MFCLKCGKETTDNQVFCDSCLQTMERYPVKPDAAVHLPRHTDPLPVKKQGNRKRALSPEEQISHLKTLLRWMTACAALLAIVLCLATVLLVKEYAEETPPRPVGRNYTIDTNQND